MGKFFSAIKLGYELISAILALQAGGSYTWWPVYQGKGYKVTIENA